MKVSFFTWKVMYQLHPFNFKKKKWPEDKTVQEIDLGKKDSKDQCCLKKALYLIDSSESPELYVKFIERFEFNILCPKKIKF